MSYKLPLRSALAGLAGILIAIGGCAESPSAPAAPDASGLRLIEAPLTSAFSVSGSGAFEASAVIGAEGGTLVGPGGASITFPAGALAEPTRISMSPIRGFLGVDLQPHGLQFPASAQPVLSLPLAGVRNGHTSLWIVYVETGKILEVLPSTTRDGFLTAPLPHFSGYIGAD